MAWTEGQRTQLADKLIDLWPSFTDGQAKITLDALARFNPFEVNVVLDGLFASQETPHKPTVREILDSMPRNAVRPAPSGPCGLCGGDEDWPIELRAAKPDRLEALQIPPNLCATLMWISSRTDIPERDRRRQLVVVDTECWEAMAKDLEPVSLPFKCPRCAPQDWPKSYTTPALEDALKRKWRIQAGYEHRIPTLQKVLRGIPINQGPLLTGAQIARDDGFWTERFTEAATEAQLDWLEDCRDRLGKGGEILAGEEP